MADAFDAAMGNLGDTPSASSAAGAVPSNSSTAEQPDPTAVDRYMGLQPAATSIAIPSSPLPQAPLSGPNKVAPWWAVGAGAGPPPPPRQPPSTRPGSGNPQDIAPGCVGGCQRNSHCCDLGFSMVTFGVWVAFLVLCVFGDWMLFPWILGPIFVYLIYLGARFISRTRGSLRAVMDTEAAKNFFDTWLAVSPVNLEWSIQCYHSETRTRSVSDGNGGTKTETYQVRVDTWSARKLVPVKCIADRTALPRVPDNAWHVVNVVKNSIIYVFDTPADRSKHKAAYDDWIVENDKDIHKDTKTMLVIPGGFKPKVTELLPGAVLPWWYTLTHFWVCSVLILSWPYSMLVEAISSREERKFVKVLSLGDNFPG